MSIETVNQFLTKVSQDEKLQSELSQAIQEHQDFTVVVNLAAQHGYEFTTEEFKQQIEQMQNAKKEQLSEEELETVAGGIPSTAITSIFSAQQLIDQSNQLINFN